MDELRLDDLQLVAALAEAESLSAAAAALGMPKQTVSRRLEILERAVGVALVARGGHRLRLTESGQLLAERAREVLRLAEEALIAVHDAQLDPTGVLRVTTTATIAQGWLAELIPTYLARHPQAAIEVLATDRHVDLVEEGFDLALRVGPLSSAAGVAARLAPAAIRYVATPAYLAAHGAPRVPADLDVHVTLTQPLGPWPFVGGARAVRGRLHTNDVELVRAAALRGAGIALLPEPLCADDLAAGRLVEVLRDHVPEVGAIWLVTPERRPPARVRAFVALLRERLGA